VEPNPTTVGEQLYCALAYLANTGHMPALGRDGQRGTTTAQRAIHNVCGTIVAMLAEEFFKWPSTEGALLDKVGHACRARDVQYGQLAVNRTV
jgi:hypothetical protein